MGDVADIFTCSLEWSGAAAGATKDANFSRDLTARFDAGPEIPMSAAPSYKGDASRLNPEQLFVASLSACQALTYLFLAARAGVVIAGYADRAEGRLALIDGRIRMSEVILHPAILLEQTADTERARELIQKAHQQCFVANSASTRVRIDPTFDVR
jgi:organic hydroperoxide reductase OsmC/OhrA